MRHSQRRTALTLTLALPCATAIVGCTTETRGPTGIPGPPIASPQPPPAPVAPPPPPPTIAEPAVRYRRVSPSSYPNGGGDAYVLSLGPDSSFAIVFPGGDTYWAWSGQYTRADSVLVFHYNAWSAAGPLEARGTLRGDLLVLRYNLVMQMTDFEDGVYVRDPPVP